MAINGEKRQLGFKGEKLAVKHLKKSGYVILERNFRCKTGEIDVIAQLGEVIAFVEVKTRTGDRFGTPAEAVDGRRQQRYRNTANFFMYFTKRDLNEYIVRFDIIEVIISRDGKVINHFENAFG